jgi:ubiquinone/menaquinone biosynthesis C-methylase UbiE
MTKAAPASVQREERDLADFYEKLAFPSRTSHPEYAALVAGLHGERIGDFGCGQGIFHEALRNYSPQPIFLDVTQKALRSLEYGNRVQGDLFALPLVDAALDRIFCIGVLHHLHEVETPLAELARVLRPGGQLVVGVYAQASAQASLRACFAALQWKPWQNFIFAVTHALLLRKYAKAGRPLSAADARARTIDFLAVPRVRYTAPAFYEERAALAGLQCIERRRISGMNLLFLQRSS